MLNPEVEALLAQGKCPAHCSTRDVHDQLRPMLKMGAALRNQLSYIHELLIDAELAPHDDALDGKFERLRATLRELDTSVPQFIALGRNIGRAMARVERVLGDDHDLLHTQAGVSVGGPPDISRV